MSANPPTVHPTADVERGAAIGDGTAIWHHCHIRAGARIGRSCKLGRNVYVDVDVRIGDRVKVQNNVSVYRGVELADDVFVGPLAVFTNDLRPRSHNGDWQVVPTRVDSGASICAGAVIVCGVDIGAHAMVAAGAVVTRNVRPHQLVGGNPARHLGWVCECGAVVSRDQPEPERGFRCSQCARQAAAQLSGVVIDG
jgi:UDP-2-acetamido-3-amino-2,3-dideoxy-glucuronate N-acetyltransferase